MDNSESTTKQTKGKIGMKVYKHIFHLTHWSELVKGNHNSMPYPIPDLREHNQMGVERKKHNHCHQHLQTVGFFFTIQGIPGNTHQNIQKHSTVVALGAFIMWRRLSMRSIRWFSFPSEVMAPRTRNSYQFCFLTTAIPIGTQKLWHL